MIKEKELKDEFELLNKNIIKTTKNVNDYLCKRAYKFMILMVFVIIFCIFIMAYVSTI